MEGEYIYQRSSRWGEGGELKDCSHPLNQNLKTQRFHRQDDIKCFTFFTLQSKSAIEIC